MPGPLLLVGCGKMGGALLDGWLDQGMAPGGIFIVEPNLESVRKWADAGVRAVAGPGDLDDGITPETVLFAVKPQVMDVAAPPYGKWAGQSLFVSIAAGRSCAYFESVLGSAAAVARVMPNTPAAVGRGISVIYANANVDDAGRARAEGLMSAVGEVAWIADEGLLDGVTGVSGSGPAYVFLMVECLADAGRSAGLPPDLAMQLARATVSGSGELLRQSPESAEQLRVNVTSPGGTTAAALEVLMGPNGLRELMTDAVARAAARSRELAG